MLDLSSFIQTSSKRTNFLSVGVRLCFLVAAVCAAPLAFVTGWIAVWLLSLMTVLVFGTFGVWAFHAVRNPRLLDTEEHTEQMAATSVFAQNRTGDMPLLKHLQPAALSPNPELSGDQSKAEEQ